MVTVQYTVTVVYSQDPDEHTTTYVVREATAEKLIDAVRANDNEALVGKVSVHIKTLEKG